MSELEQEVLRTLSFFDPMNLEKIILDFDSKYVMEHLQFSRDELLSCLEHLVRQKIIDRIDQDGEPFWIKRMKKRTIIQKLLLFFSKGLGR